MRFEVFHTGLLGRPNIIAVDMIQYPGLWGICLSHHLPNNNHPRYAADTSTLGTLRFIETALDERDGLDFGSLAGHVVTTHHVDADAVLPVWALLNPEAAMGRRRQLEEVARSGDFFIYLDETSARINAVIEGIHLRLRGRGRAGQRLVDAPLTQACFDWLLPRMESLLDDPTPYAEFWEPPLQGLHSDLSYLRQPGRVTEYWHQHLSLIETDHDPDVHALNTVCRNDLLLVWRTDSAARRLDVRPAIAWYELTSVPHRPHYGLSDLARRLNDAESATSDCPVWTYQAGPVSLSAESSQLPRQELIDHIQDWLDRQSEAQVPAAYRADIAEVYRFRDHHLTFDSHHRFARSRQISFRPGVRYAGLHFLGAKGAHIDGGMLQTPGRTHPLPFAVADDFYWNEDGHSTLELDVAYADHGAGMLEIEYDSWLDPVRPTTPARLQGDGQIRTTRFALPAARMGASQEDGADFRVRFASGAPVALKELTLRKV